MRAGCCAPGPGAAEGAGWAGGVAAPEARVGLPVRAQVVPPCFPARAQDRASAGFTCEASVVARGTELQTELLQTTPWTPWCLPRAAAVR